MRITIASVLFLQLSTGSVFAQQPTFVEAPSGHVARPASAELQRPVSLLALARAATMAADLGQAPAASATRALPPAKSWRQRHPVAFGALMGAAVGGGTGALVGAANEDDSMVTAEGLMLFGVGIGAGVGAIVGLLIHQL